MARPIKVITASEEVRAELEWRSKAPKCAYRDRFRARIVLARLDGMGIKDVAGRVNASTPVVSKWSSRFERFGLEGLKDKTGRGRKPSIPAAISIRPQKRWFCAAMRRANARRSSELS